MGSNWRADTYHSSEGWRNQAAVDGDEAAADQRLWTERRTNEFFEVCISVTEAIKAVTDL